MTRFCIIDDDKRNELLAKLKEQFGISQINGTLLTLGHDKIRLLTADISADDLDSLGSIIHIDISGLYLLTIEKDGIRLSHDAVILFRNQISKNIIDVTKEQELEWLKGHDVLLSKEQEKIYSGIKGFVVIRSNGELLGCGKLGNDGRIRNYVHKERILK